MKTLAIIICCALSISVMAQNSKSLENTVSFTWTNSVFYLPSIYKEAESYHYDNGKIKHQYFKTKGILNRTWESKKVLIFKNKKNVLEAYSEFLTYSEQKAFKIGLSPKDKNALLDMSNRKNNLGFPLYYANENDLLKYISNSDTINLEMEEFNTNYCLAMDRMAGSMDGSPFKITLEIVDQKNDSIKYEIIGNLGDDVKNTSVNEFLTFYAIYQNTQLFKYTPLQSYFGKENLYKVILRYIGFKEHKVNREEYILFDS